MASETVLELTDDNFASEVLESDKPVLVDFWAEWCSPCRMLGPTIEQVATQFNGKVKVGKLDTESNRQATMDYGIQALPTLLVFKNGQVVRKLVGLQPKSALEQTLNEVL